MKIRLHLFFLLPACLGIAAPLHAQFNGPNSLSGAPEMNRPVTLTTDQALLFPTAHDVVLGPGDLISIHIFAQPEYAPVVRLGVDGNVLMPEIDIVHLGGLTITSASELIAKLLVDAGIYRHPQVTLQISEGPNAVATVVGEAHGIVPIVGTRRLLDVLTTVGGLPGTASHVITIHRPGQADPLVVDLGNDPLRSQMADIPIFPGDTIIIGRVGVVYILGAFKGGTGTIPITPYAPLTLMQATAVSGGLAFDGNYNDLRLIRTVGGERTVVKVDIKKVIYGKAPDPLLQPNDIIFLPSNTIKASLSNGTLGTFLGIAGLLLSLSLR